MGALGAAGDFRPALQSELRIVSFSGTMSPMGKHEKTLQAIFSDLVRSNIKWSDIEAMIKANGVENSVRAEVLVSESH